MSQIKMLKEEVQQWEDAMDVLRQKTDEEAAVLDKEIEEL